MQLDVGSEPYLSTAQALCLFISHPFYSKSFANWHRITAMANSEHSRRNYCLIDLRVVNVHAVAKGQ